MKKCSLRCFCRYNKTLGMLCCTGFFTLALFSSCAFALPQQQKMTFESNTSILIEGKPTQQSITQGSNTNVKSGNTPTQTKTFLSYDLSNGLCKQVTSNIYINNINKQYLTTCLRNQIKQSATTGKSNQAALSTALTQNQASQDYTQKTILRATGASSPIGYIIRDSETKEYTSANEFLAAINNASNADVYFCQDIAFNNTIEIKDNAKITIHLCGHVLKGQNISFSFWDYVKLKENKPIIEIKQNAILTILGSENDEQASQAHTLRGFDENGEMKTYDNIKGGVITADQDDDIIGIEVSGDNATIFLTSTTIFGCVDTEDEGAGIDIDGKNTELCLNNSHIQHCYADYGGGIYCNAEGVTIKDTAYNPNDETTKSTISNNKAISDGGGIYSNGSNLKVNRLYIHNNHANNGGGICVDDDNNTFSECTFTNNGAETGGGIRINKYDENTTITNCSFYNNKASEDGGGAYINSEDNTFDGCTFTDNTSTKAGSALYDNNDGNKLNTCTITDNCSQGDTGAVYVCNTVDIILEGIIDISNNTGRDVYLARDSQEAYINIDPNKFDVSSNVGIYVENAELYTTCVKSINGELEKYAGCFFSNNNSEWIIDCLKGNETELVICMLIGCIQIGSETKEYDDVSKFVDDISAASEADVYLYKDIDLNNTITIQDESTITIHLCGHILSGKDITSHSENKNEPIIKVGYKANHTVIGNEDEAQASQTHTLNGFDENGDKQLYNNVRGGVITASQNDDIIGINISNNHSTVTLKNTTIFGCSDTEDEGAGIDIRGNNTNLYLEYSHIQHCRADSGGAIHVSNEANSSCISIDNSSIDNNHADDYGAGFNICGKETKLSLSASHIQHCHADSGGAIYLGSEAGNSSISMSYSSIENNHADDHGAGIYCDAEGVTIEDTAYNPNDETAKSTIFNNKADDDGGGIYSNGSNLKVNRLYIHNNHANNGGGICVDDDNNTFSECTFTNNGAKTGGGIRINKYDENTTITNCSFYNNNASEDGGGAYINSEDNTFDGCTFTDNTSTKAGSALFDNNDGNKLNTCTITNNTSNANTGAVYVDSWTNITLNGVMNISNNTGGDVYLVGEFDVTRALILIDPKTFDNSSNVGLFLSKPKLKAKCVNSTEYIKKDTIACFFIDSIGGQSNKYKIGLSDVPIDNKKRLIFFAK